METHFHDFLTMLRVERNVSTHTMDAYKRDINQYLVYLGDLDIKNLSDVKSTHIRDYIRISVSYTHLTLPTSTLV